MINCGNNQKHVELYMEYPFNSRNLYNILSIVNTVERSYILCIIYMAWNKTFKMKIRTVICTDHDRKSKENTREKTNRER